MQLRGFFWFPAVAAVVLCGIIQAGEPDLEQAADEKMLREAGVATDGRSLLAFFKERTLTDADRARLRDAVRLLGDDDFHVREKATQDLKAGGKAVLPLLRPALRDPDPEVVYRARRCYAGLERTPDLSLMSCAARLLAARRPPQTIGVLLAYVPMADDDYARDAIVQTLATVGLRDGVPDAAILAAAKDHQPARRAAAAYVLARAAEGHRGSLANLLTDSDARVRFQAASGLLRRRDKAGIPTLLTLLTDGPRETAWQAEDLLSRIAADRAPALSLSGDDASRKKCRAAWEDWWEQHGGTADLTRLEGEEPSLGLTVICDCDLEGKYRLGTVWECGPDGKPRWQIKDLKNPADVQLLPGGRVLVAECQGFVVTERDRQGKVLWSHTVDNYPVSCHRLANGNTFIATYGELCEVSRDGKKMYSHKKPGSIYCAQKLRNGNILYATSGGAIVEMEPSGKQVHSLAVEGLSAWAGVELLPNGHFLVAQYSINRVAEVDATGRVYWEGKVQTPAWCTRLPNGHTLIASTEGRCIVELDRAGKEIWKLETQGRPFRVRRH